MTTCSQCKRKLHKKSMTVHNGRKMCPRCKRLKIEQTSQLDKQNGNG